jgi:hypothetical protein
MIGNDDEMLSTLRYADQGQAQPHPRRRQPGRAHRRAARRNALIVAM